MKIICKDIIFQDGKLEDALGNEIKIRDGAEIKIIALENDFLPDEVSALDPIDQLEEIQSRKFTSFKKIVDKGTHLYFRLRKKGEIFQIELLENLYLIYKSDLKKERQIFLYPCASQIFDKLNPVRAYSLTDLYKKIYIKEFGDKGSNAINAFKEFFILDDFKISLDILREDWRGELKSSNQKGEY